MVAAGFTAPYASFPTTLTLAQSLRPYSAVREYPDVVGSGGEQLV